MKKIILFVLMILLNLSLVHAYANYHGISMPDLETGQVQANENDLLIQFNKDVTVTNIYTHASNTGNRIRVFHYNDTLIATLTETGTNTTWNYNASAGEKIWIIPI